MKKEYHLNIVTKIWPIFFWHRCDKCKMLFRREKGWLTTAGPYLYTEIGPKGRDEFLCCDCAPTRAKANQYFFDKRQKIKDSRPPPSPAPPKKRGIA